MRKKLLSRWWAGALFISFLPAALCAQDASAPPVAREELTTRSIRDQVKTLREERFDQMPYLDRGFIRSSLTAAGVEEKNRFIALEKQNLKNIIERAIQVHTPARASRERISLARRRILVAVRNLLPEAGVEFQHRDGSLSASPFNSRYYKVSFRQPVFRGGILWNTLLQENMGLQAAEKEYDQVIADLVNDVSAAYFEFNRTLEVVTDYEKELETLRRFVEISKQKFDEQFISEIEHLNVESLYSQLEYDYETSKQELELAKLDLQRFLDLSFEDRLEITALYDVNDLIAKDVSAKEGEPDVQPPGKGTYEGYKETVEIPNLNALVDLAYDHRPELQVESARLQSARLEERIRWGELLPRADVVLEFGRLGEAFNDDSFDPKLRKEFRLLFELSWNAGGNRINYTFENNEQAPSVTQFQGGAGTQITRNTVRLGLLDGLQSIADAKEAEVEKLDQIVELENAEKQVIQDVKEAYFDYQRSLIQLESTLKRLEYRKRLTLLAEHRLEKNEIQISEYLQAQVDLLREHQEFHRALKDYFTAKAKLNRSLGMREFLAIEEKYGT